MKTAAVHILNGHVKCDVGSWTAKPVKTVKKVSKVAICFKYVILIIGRAKPKPEFIRVAQCLKWNKL